jgi:monoamine oxidase
VRVDGPDGEIEIEAARVVLAMPPRLVAATDLSPALDPDFRARLAAVPTWMAGHAKFLAVYDTPFWVGQGLSGDAISHRGPMAEIHDASPHPGGTGALFGFLGVPAEMRLAHAEALPAACLAQLVALFGPAAGEPRATVYRDWADNPFTATAADHSVPAGHPAYGLPSSGAVQWDGRLILSGTETAGGDGGFLEGALEAAETASALILEG